MESMKIIEEWKNEWGVGEGVLGRLCLVSK